jgi:ATP-dependent exoDNAse (exonuclease V) alpha subunit
MRKWRGGRVQPDDLPPSVGLRARALRIAVADGLIIRNDAARDLANGDRFTVAAVTPASVTLTDGKRRVEVPADKPLHLDHAYATTVHSSQGTTAERVLIDAATRSRTM